MYYVLQDDGIVSARTLEKLNRKTRYLLSEEEFYIFGSDKFVKVAKEDVSFLQDKKKLSMIPISNLYKKDNTIKILLIINLIMIFIVMVKG